MKWDITYLKWKWFDANPQNINRAWRPRKQLSYIIEEIKDLWYTSPSQSEIVDICSLILSLTESDMKIIAEWESYPMLMRIIATKMLWMRGFETVEKILDRIYGKMIAKKETEDNTISFIIKSVQEEVTISDEQHMKIVKEYLRGKNLTITEL